jgi:hypothetical protein
MMKIKLLLFSVALAIGFQSQAQWVTDSVAMGPNYGSDIYYSMSKGAQGSPVSNTNWHLGFEMIPGGPGFGGVSIIANHVQGGVKVYSLHLTGSSKFMTLAAGDTMIKTQLYNADTNWDWGAFNTNASSTLFDYGWGQYNSTTHMVDGDSLYLLYIGATPYKMHITHYNSFPTASIYYAFHIAKFDGSNDYQDTIRKSPNYMNKNFAYFDVTNNTELNREPDQKTWDVVFARYMDYKAGPPGAPYPTMGVLSNVGVSVADVRPVNPDTTVSYNSYVYTKAMNEIGFDWKSFTPPGGPWLIDTTATFFVKTKDTALYQIKFIKFESGSGPTGTGKVVFAKRVWKFPVGINTPANSNILAHAIMPNPASNSADIAVEAKENGTAMIYVTDITGKIVVKNNVTLNAGINGFNINTSNYTAGTYIVTITNGSWKINEKLIVQH